eukprot:7382503-Prymnesium_polylepis.1
MQSAAAQMRHAGESAVGGTGHLYSLGARAVTCVTQCAALCVTRMRGTLRLRDAGVQSLVRFLVAR